MKARLLLALLAATGCDPHVVDAVEDPAPTPVAPSPLETSLVHRYSFDGKGSVARDSRGAAHGQILVAKLNGSDTLALAGERSGEYVNLPNGILSGLSAATFEAWLSWNGGASWQRIFDFGSSISGEDMPAASGTSYLFLTPKSDGESSTGNPAPLRLSYSQSGREDEERCDGLAAFPVGSDSHHVAAVIDPASKSMALYQDGALLDTCPLTRSLSAIEDVNDWLGHSNYAADADLNGTYDEFRIYAAALTATQIADSYAAGPDAGH